MDWIPRKDNEKADALTEIFQHGFWRNAERLEDPHLKALAEKIARSCSGITSTRDCSPVQWSFSEISIIFSSVERAFYGIRWAHTKAGAISPTYNVVQSILAAKSILGKPKGKEQAITPEVLANLSSKTDQYREGNWVSIARMGKVTCPVAMLEKYCKSGRNPRAVDGHLARGQAMLQTASTSVFAKPDAWKFNLVCYRLCSNYNGDCSDYEYCSGGRSLQAAGQLSQVPAQPRLRSRGLVQRRRHLSSRLRARKCDTPLLHLTSFYEAERGREKVHEEKEGSVDDKKLPSPDRLVGDREETLHNSSSRSLPPNP
ncbi:hypothetical protein Bbelb_318420 [Branchiostoma belcheri]|nr:hypothetical protein Bbelb_318420 [Branchiostoma belcheri]